MKNQNVTRLIIIFFFNLTSILAIVKIEEKGTFPKVVTLIDKKIFVFTNINSFIYDFATKSQLNIRVHDEKYSDKDISESAVVFINDKIKVIISKSIIIYNVDGSFIKKKDLNIQDLEKRVKDYSIIGTDTGKIIISCIINDNGKTKILHVSFEEEDTISTNITEEKNSSAQPTESIDCKFKNTEEFICFYFLDENGIRNLVAGVFKNNDMSFVSSVKTLSTEGQYINSVKFGDYFGICYTTWSAEGLCTLYDSINKSLLSVKSFVTKGLTHFTKMGFVVARGKNNTYIFLVMRQNQVHLIHFNNSLDKVDELVTYTISQSYQQSAGFFLEDNQQEILIFDKQEGGVYLYYFEKTDCVDICKNKENGEQSVTIRFPETVDSAFRFSTVSLNYGTLLNHERIFKTREEKIVSLATERIYFSSDINLVYNANSEFVQGIEKIEYYTVLSSSKDIPVQKCNIIIYNGDSGKCPCVSQNGNSKLYHLGSQCVSECPSYTILDTTDDTCYTCKKFNKYLYNNQCLDQKPSNTFISDINTNLLEDCKLPCKTCQDSATFCLTCTDGYNLSMSNNGKCILPDNLIISETDESLDDVIDSLEDLVKDNNDNDAIIKGKGFVLEIKDSSSKNDRNLSQIDLGECEVILRKNYGIKENEKLLIAKIDIERNNSLTDKVEYSVFDANGNKLDLSLCKDIEIKITSPIKDPEKINKALAEEFNKEGIDIFDSKDSFFNDICYPYSTKNKRDVTISDRRTDIYQNVSLCDSECEYDHINLEKNTVDCKCKVKEEINTKIDAKFFYFGLRSVLESSNFAVVLCYNLVFSKKIIIHNYGFWFFLFLNFLHIPLLIIYCIKGITPIRNFVNKLEKSNPPPFGSRDYIDKIINQENNGDELEKIREAKYLSKQNSTRYSDNSRNNQESYKRSKFFGYQSQYNNSRSKFIIKKRHQNNNYFPSKESIDISSDGNSEIKDDLNTKKENEFESIRIFPRKNKENPVLNNFSKNLNNVNSKKYKLYNSQTSEQKNLDITLFSSDKLPKFSKKEVRNTTTSLDTLQTGENNKNGFNFRNNKKKPSDDFLDDFIYEEAIIYDTRTFLKCYYLSLLTKQSVLECFVYKSPLELRIARIMLFIFSNSMDFAFNALFYMESMISDRYHYEGKAGFLFTLQNNIYSTLASCLVGFILTTILNTLSNSKKKLESIQEEKRDLALENKIFKCLKIKLFFFMIFEMAFMMFFWYYVSAFCAVYQSSQISWLQGGLISFLIGNVIPFGVALLIAILHRISLVKKIPCLFKFSIWLYSL